MIKLYISHTTIIIKVSFASKPFCKTIKFLTTFLLDLSHKRVEERVQTNFDHPDSLDTGLMIEHVKELRKGNAIQVPSYCFKTHCRMEKFKHVTPKPITIVEGILIFTDVDLRKELDLMVYVVSLLAYS